MFFRTNGNTICVYIHSCLAWHLSFFLYYIAFLWLIFPSAFQPILFLSYYVLGKTVILFSDCLTSSQRAHAHSIQTLFSCSPRGTLYSARLDLRAGKPSSLILSHRSYDQTRPTSSFFLSSSSSYSRTLFLNPGDASAFRATLRFSTIL